MIARCAHPSILGAPLRIQSQRTTFAARRSYRALSFQLHAYLMTDATDNAAAPPKKRFGFKKAAWQMEPKTEERDMFSHANEFSTIVAEEARRKSELKKKAEQAQKRKQDEEREAKRRRVSAEVEESLPSTGSRSTTRGRRLAGKGYVRGTLRQGKTELTVRQTKQDASFPHPPRFDFRLSRGALRFPHKIFQQLARCGEEFRSCRLG